MSDIISLNIELKSVVTLEHTGLGGAWAHCYFTMGPWAHCHFTMGPSTKWAQVRNRVHIKSKTLAYSALRTVGNCLATC